MPRGVLHSPRGNLRITEKNRRISAVSSRGWENRTPAKSFGDFCHTIWPIPFIYLQNCIHATSLFYCFFVAISTTFLLWTSFFNRKFNLTTFDWTTFRLRLALRLRLVLVKSPGQTLDRLVTVSSMHYCTSTPALSTSSSSRGLTSFEWDISSWGGLHA